MAASESVRDSTMSIPAVLYAVVFASTCIVIGLIWDVSWHRTVGRDTFWTLAHVLEQFAAIIAGLSCGWLALRTSFAASPVARAQSVRFWHYFYAPLGAWVCIWGTMMMIASAPLDNWWHNAYGLDVKIISPPHMILAAGMIGIQFGAMLMTVSSQNRAPAEHRRAYAMLYAFSAGILLAMLATIVQEDASVANQMHRAAFYRVTAVVVPIALFGFARGCRLKWPATTMALVYSGIILGMMWILQLFPTTPRLAPIYNPVTHMVPPSFPLLLVVPAMIGDAIMQKTGLGKDWGLSLTLGVIFVAVMLVVHWFWAEFLISPHARNLWFGADQWSYTDRLGPWRYQFWLRDFGSHGKFSARVFAGGIATAAGEAIVSTRIGLWLGNGISRVRR